MQTIKMQWSINGHRSYDRIFYLN